jgi:hypothetical protein
LRLRKGEYVGGVEAGGFYSLRGERSNHNSAINICNHEEYSVRGAHRDILLTMEKNKEK